MSAFWGRPMYVGAVVLLPEGFDEHPDAHYPVLYYQGHFAVIVQRRLFRTEASGAAGGGRGRGGRGGDETATLLSGLDQRTSAPHAHRLHPGREPILRRLLRRELRQRSDLTATR